jgi:hypothetical protein
MIFRGEFGAIEIPRGILLAVFAPQEEIEFTSDG